MTKLMTLNLGALVGNWCEAAAFGFNFQTLYPSLLHFFARFLNVMVILYISTYSIYMNNMELILHIWSITTTDTPGRYLTWKVCLPACVFVYINRSKSLFSKKDVAPGHSYSFPCYVSPDFINWTVYKMESNDYSSYLKRKKMVSMVRVGMSVYRDKTNEEVTAQNLRIQRSNRQDFYYIAVTNVTAKDEETC